MSQPKRILCIHAHPDDIEILAGGALALLTRRGHRVTIVTMAPGDCGSTEYSPERTAEIRREEARSGAAVLGADYFCAEFRDLAIYSDDASRRRVTAILRRFQPDVVLTASPVDYMCDHEATSELVRDSCFAAPAPNFITSAYDAAPALEAIPHLYFADPIGGVDRDGAPILPDFIVDVSATFAVKREALAKHDSQRQWLRRHHGMDNYLETMEQWTRLRGSLAGFEYGEGFRIYKGHPYPQTPLLEELLGLDRVFRRSPPAAQP